MCKVCNKSKDLVESYKVLGEGERIRVSLKV